MEILEDRAVPAATIPLNGASSVLEGNEYTLAFGPVNNPDGITIESYRVDWGDSQTSTGFGVPAGSLGHVYGDGPATRAVTLTLVGGEVSHIAGMRTVNVANAFPSVATGWPLTISEGSSLVRSGSFSDSGADTWSATVDYGDGGGPQNLSLNSDKTFNLNHAYVNDGLFSVTVIVTDDDNGEGAASFDVTVENVAPTFEAGADINVPVGSVFTRNGAFVDPGADAWTATVDYGDGGGPHNLALNGKSYVLNHTYNHTGSFTVTVTIDDGDGGIATDSFVVTTAPNTVPSVSLGADATVAEGAMFTRSISFTDPDLNSWSATVDYGDGQGPQSLPLTGRSFTLSHAYADNGAFPITVVISDGFSTASSVLNLTVANVPPTVAAGGNVTLNLGDSLDRAGSFTDPGNDTWTGTVDFGDGQGEQALTLSGKTFNLAHTYTSAGTFTVTVRITDKNNGIGVATFTVTQRLQVNLSPATVVEHAPAATVVGTLSTGGTVLPNLTLLDGAGRFLLNGAQVVVASNADLNFEIAMSHTIRVRASAGDQMVEQDLVIQVANIVEGDGLVGRDPATGSWIVAQSTGASFVTRDWGGAFPTDRIWVDVLVADFTGDGLDDVAARDAARGEWWLARSTGSAFVAQVWDAWPSAAWVNVMAVDLDLDGRADLLGRNPASGQWLASFSQGSHGLSAAVANWLPGLAWTDVNLIDANGDRRPDLVGRVGAAGFFQVMLNTAIARPGAAMQFVAAASNLSLFDGNLPNRTTWSNLRFTDFNGDGVDEVIGLNVKSGRWYVSARGGVLSESLADKTWPNAWQAMARVDVNGDDRDDLIGRVDAGSTQEWWAYLAGNQPASIEKLGVLAGPVVETLYGDFNGDDKSDVAALRDNGEWNIGIINAIGEELSFNVWDIWPIDHARFSLRTGRFTR